MDPTILKKQIYHQFKCLKCILDECNSEYNNFVFIDDYKENVNESSMKEFSNLNGLKSLFIQ